MPAAPPIAEFADELLLRERLIQAFPEGRRRTPSVAVGFAHESRTAFACTSGALAGSARRCAGLPQSGAHVAALALHAGCLTKLFTAALAAQARAEGRLALDEPVEQYLALPHASAFRGITLRHLLEHTHGLDGSALAAAPLRRDAYIDTPALCRKLGEAPPLSKPGRLYSYSNAGAWVTAALLERTSGQRYSALLHERILDSRAGRKGKVQATAANGAADPATAGALAAAGQAAVCPATGGALRVSLGTLLRFLVQHAPRGALEDRPRGRRVITPLPGWNALERGVYLGWKYHGEDWLGHQSIWPENSVLVRVQAQTRLALVVACRGLPAAIAAARLFGSLLPEFQSLRIPRTLTRAQTAGLNPRLYTGLYACARRAVLVQRQGEHLALRGCTLDATRLPGEPPIEARLRPSEKQIFFTDPPVEPFSFVQFVSPYCGGFRRIWNGRFLLCKRSG